MFSAYYNALGKEDMARIHEASLEVLQTTGLRLTHPLALEKLAGAGAKVDLDQQRVCLIADMVDAALATFPKTFLCAGRTAEYDFTVGDRSSDSPAFRSVGGPLHYFDPRNGQSRPLGIEDCADIAQMVDGLAHMNILATVTPQDIPQETYDVEILKVYLENSRRHIWALTTDSKNLKYQLEMMVAVAGGGRELKQRPICSGIVCLIDPLYFPDDEIERLLLYGQYNLPVRVPLCPVVGANAPYTLAGVVVQANAEALGTLTLLQTLCPGIPTWYYPLVRLMDMRKGATSATNPESLLLLSACCCMARSYGIPPSTTSLLSSSGQPHQILLERTTGLTAAAMAGSDELGGMGGIGGGMMISPVTLAIDHELSAFIKKVLRGFKVDTDSLATDAINRVGHGGNFLEDLHTLHHLRTEERFSPALITTTHFELLQEEDPDTIYDRAAEQIAQLQQHHQVPPLETGLKKELDRILTAAKNDVDVY